MEDKTYDFAAYSPDLTGVATVAADVANKAISFTNFVSDKDRQHDLIYAHVSNATHERKVQFSFSHALSMIRFTFKSAFGENTTLHIKDFKFYGMNSQGNYSYRTDKMDWDNHTTPVIESTAFTNSDLEIPGTEEKVTDDYLVIPQSVPAQTMTVSFTAEIWTNGAEAATKSKPITVQLQTLENGWTAGQCYNYTVTIDGGESGNEADRVRRSDRNGMAGRARPTYGRGSDVNRNSGLSDDTVGKHRNGSGGVEPIGKPGGNDMTAYRFRRVSGRKAGSLPLSPPGRKIHRKSMSER